MTDANEIIVSSVDILNTLSSDGDVNKAYKNVRYN
jgi:hypothetical protein